MAGLLYTVHTAEIAMVAATAKTILMVKQAANQRGKCRGWGVSFDGTSVSAEPILIELCRTSTDGTGAATPPSGMKTDPSHGETIQSTITHNFSAEPTITDILARREIHPQGGYEVLFPLGQEKLSLGGGRICIRVTAPAIVNAIGFLEMEE